MKNVFIKLRLLIVMLLMSPMVLLAQNPGDNPDARPQDPQDVPLDGSMMWLLVAAGLVLSVVVLRRVLKAKATAA